VGKTDFKVGQDNFDDIEIVPQTSQLYGFRHRASHDMVHYFVLNETPAVDHMCQVSLVRKDQEKFSPRLIFSIRNHNDKSIVETDHEPNERPLKACVDLTKCHEKYWELISYLRSLRELDIPDKRFTLITKDAKQIADAISEHDPETVRAVLTLVSKNKGVQLTIASADEILRRKANLETFKRGIEDKKNEPWWKVFFDDNKWIFGYGLDYRILNVEHSQGHLASIGLDGKGEMIPDYMASTGGNAKFMVAVEIKTPEASLIVGPRTQRSGAWKLSQELMDAITQVQAYVQEWSHYSSKHPKNAVINRRKNIRTIQPKGIVVIGNLYDISNDEEKLSTFELFRQALHGIDIITFDELCERAEFIVRHSEKDAGPTEAGASGKD